MSGASAFEQPRDDFAAAFDHYNETFRPFIEQIQGDAVRTSRSLVPRTEAAIRQRNADNQPF